MQAKEETFPFVLQVDVPGNQNDTCFYQGTDAKDDSITANIQLCPEVVIEILFN